MNVSKISKYMSFLLRHNPGEENLSMDRYGWVSTKKLIYALDISMEDLDKIVETNSKKRFELSKNKAKIRACQGHSVDILLGLSPVEPPEFLYHGTSEENKMGIITEGISKMKRNHVHLSPDTETALEVGKRHGEPIVLTIRTKEMYEDGIKFYCSKNGVWLTEFVAPRYIQLNL